MPDGSPAFGTVSIRPVQTFLSVPDAVTIVAVWDTYELDENGDVEIEIYPHDNTDPSPIHFIVLESVPGCGHRNRIFALPSSIPDGQTINLSAYRSVDLINTNQPPVWNMPMGADQQFWGYGITFAQWQVAYAPGGVRAGVTPANGEARIGPSGDVETYYNGIWSPAPISPSGDEYHDLISGNVYAVT
jgi:hypothetical protein